MLLDWSGTALTPSPSNGASPAHPLIRVNFINLNAPQTDYLFAMMKLGEGSIDRPAGCRQENHEAFQYSSALQKDVPRIEAAEAPATRKRQSARNLFFCVAVMILIASRSLA